MKHLRKSLLGLCVLLLMAVALLWFLPARLAMPWVEPHLHGLRLQKVQGSVWNGRAAEVVTAQGDALGQLQWRLSRLALLGQLQLQLRFDGPQLQFSGTVQRLPGDRIALHDVDVHGELAALDVPMSPVGQPLGELQVTADQVVLQGGWPLQLRAQGHWRHAVMRTSHGDVSLGGLDAQAQAENGWIQARLRDEGNGPLHVDGQLQLSPLGWRLDAALRPRQTDPALQRWLISLGPASADGSVHIHRNGGLVAIMPAQPPN